MKIAYCIPLITGTGGMERVLSLKANYLVDSLGYEVFIIITDHNNHPPFYTFSPKIKIINLAINYEELWTKALPIRILCYFKKQKQYKKALSETLNKIKPDITISMLRREINFINSINDGSVKIGEIHYSKENYRDYRKSIPFTPLRKIATSWGMFQLIKKLKKLNMFIVLSFEDKDKWKGLDNITVIYNPLPFFPNETAQLEEKKVISVGRYTYLKGFDFLIKSWKIVNKKHPDWELHIYGEGKDQSLKNQIHSLGLSNSCFLEQSVKDIFNKYSESSIFVLSSISEGFTMALIEAMACGLPPVSFACPCGPKDIIKNGVDGILVEPGNIEELAQKICCLIENEEIRKEMGQRARTKVEKLKIDRIMNQWDELFKSFTKTRVEN